jgi:hypothetical protein
MLQHTLGKFGVHISMAPIVHRKLKIVSSKFFFLLTNKKDFITNMLYDDPPVYSRSTERTCNCDVFTPFPTGYDLFLAFEFVSFLYSFQICVKLGYLLHLC